MKIRNWLTIVGIGEGGLTALSPAALAIVEGAEVIIGGKRHLSMIPNNKSVKRLYWHRPLNRSIAEIRTYTGQRVTVLATGDPMWFGIGNTLVREFGKEAITVIPAPGAFSLAAAQMGWPLNETICLSVHGRPLSVINLHLFPGAKILVLSKNGNTPATVATMLLKRGYNKSKLTVFEHLGGGKREKTYVRTAETWDNLQCASLNTIAIECCTTPNASVFSRLAGLPDEAYEHDGQLTKREVRAVTLAALSPLPTQLLWDVGAGAGSIAIEWMRAKGSAVAFEKNLTRITSIARNADKLGVPQLIIVPGEAPHTFRGIEKPDAVFIGGGLTTPGLVESCWEALANCGRIVANAITVEGEAQLYHQQQKLGGTLTRYTVSHLEPKGRFKVWQARAPVTQWRVNKP